MFKMKYLPVFLNILLIPKIYQPNHYKHPADFSMTAVKFTLLARWVRFLD